MADADVDADAPVLSDAVAVSVAVADALAAADAVTVCDLDDDGDNPRGRLVVGVTVAVATADAEVDCELDDDAVIKVVRLRVDVCVLVATALDDKLKVGVPDAEAPRVRLPVGESEILGVAVPDALTVVVLDVETAGPLAEPLADALAPGDSVDVVEELAPGGSERVGEVVTAGPLAEPLADALAPGESEDVVEELAPGGSEHVGDVEDVLPGLMLELAEDEAVAEFEAGTPIVCDSVTDGVDDATAGVDVADTPAPVGDALDDGGAPTVSDAVAVELGSGIALAVPENDTVAGQLPSAVFDADAASDDRLPVGATENVAMLDAVTFCDRVGGRAAAQRSARKLPRMVTTQRKSSQRVSLLRGNGRKMQKN